MTGDFSLLAKRRFLPLFVTQFLGAFNDNLFKNGMVMLITFQLAEQAHMNAQLLVTMAAGIFILPFFLFSATAGQLADSMEKSRLIGYIKLAEILLMVVGALGFITGSVPVLMVTLFGMGTHSTFFGPLKYSILPDHLAERELIAGNALVEAGTFLAILLGTIVGGLLIMTAGGTTMVSALALLVAVVGWLSSRFIPPALPEGVPQKVQWNIFRETWNVIGQARRQEDVFLSIIGISWFWFVGATFLAQFPTFAKNALASNEEVVTLFLTLFSVGIAIGSMLCNRLLKGEVSGSLAPYGALGMALFTLLLYAVSPDAVPDHGVELTGFREFFEQPFAWPVMLSLLGISVCGGIYIVPLYAIMQARSEKSVRARVVAGNNILNALFMVASALMTIAMLEAGWTVNHVFLTVALLNFPVTVIVRRLVRKQQAKRQQKSQNGAA